MSDSEQLKGSERSDIETQLTELRALSLGRPDASVYLDVKNGKARLVYPDGVVEFVREGEAIRIWPRYISRPEDGRS